MDGSGALAHQTPIQAAWLWEGDPGDCTIAPHAAAERPARRRFVEFVLSFGRR